MAAGQGPARRPRNLPGNEETETQKQGKPLSRRAAMREAKQVADELGVHFSPARLRLIVDRYLTDALQAGSDLRRRRCRELVDQYLTYGRADSKHITHFLMYRDETGKEATDRVMAERGW